ncbi:hypothetical protein ILYODFUR_007682 [Ilyodon furcidens]|uniref:Uncharacterized protein n=1 Tax=Ilyodon furcidens TaxID=33524 RepID=A0ABV0V163_9TELE
MNDPVVWMCGARQQSDRANPRMRRVGPREDVDLWNEVDEKRLDFKTRSLLHEQLFSTLGSLLLCSDMLFMSLGFIFGVDTMSEPRTVTNGPNNLAPNKTFTQYNYHKLIRLLKNI